MHRRCKQWCVSVGHAAAVAVGGCVAYLGEQQREDPPLPLGRGEREVRDVREQLVKAELVELSKNKLLGWWADRWVFKTKTCHDPPDYRYELWIAPLGIKNDPWIKISPTPFGK
jgi:hypothetical protein